MFATKQSRDFVDELFSAVADLDIKGIAQLIEKDTEKFLVYSTYAKSYISKISTTYGDYLDSCVYLNKFILSSYPKIILLHIFAISYANESVYEFFKFLNMRIIIFSSEI